MQTEFFMLLTSPHALQKKKIVLTIFTIYKGLYLIGIIICSFHVGFDPSAVDVRPDLSLNVATTYGDTDEPPRCATNKSY